MGGEGRTGPIPVWYLRGVGAVEIEAWEALVAYAEPMVGSPWVATEAATTTTVVGGGATAAAAGPGLDLPVGGGEERRTQGLKLCSPRVFPMVGLEKERRG